MLAKILDLFLALEKTMTDLRSERVKFAYWVPNVSGGLAMSKIEQRTKLGYRRIAHRHRTRRGSSERGGGPAS